MIISMSTWCVSKSDFIKTPATLEEITEQVGGRTQALMLINDAMKNGEATIHNASKNNAWPVKVHAN